MKKKLFLLLWPLVAAAWLTCCRKDPPAPVKKDPCPWPEATTEGLNTFACKIDGKEWVACIDPWAFWPYGGPVNAKVRESDGSNFLSISAMRLIVDSTTSELGLNGQIFFGFKPGATGTFSIPHDLAYSSADFSAEWDSIPSYRLGFV